ncbi:hypothetical protein H6P81_010247 [Aristolochia fimbriata]|uniref:Uncharacterized protein n=1 Tax=Aristolochia fimbriata TaxID=158543 RepID=A0AAV7ERM9_ARIFI|nr:hypothetical protein H6P81_010247 [Aristolochia fimbriata]
MKIRSAASSNNYSIDGHKIEFTAFPISPPVNLNGRRLRPTRPWSYRTKPPSTVPALHSDLHLADEEDLYGRIRALQRAQARVHRHPGGVRLVRVEESQTGTPVHAEEVKRIQSILLVNGQFMEIGDQNNGIVGSTAGSNYYFGILNTINRELLKPSASVALQCYSNDLSTFCHRRRIPVSRCLASRRSPMSPI